MVNYKSFNPILFNLYIDFFDSLLIISIYFIKTSTNFHKKFKIFIIRKMNDESSNNGVLTEYMVTAKTRTNSIANIKVLNMWGYNLRDVSLIEKMPNLEIISLPVNQISHLSSFQNCWNLRELFLRQNNISDFNELKYLSNLPYLKNLSLSENPIADMPNYRKIVLQTLPHLEKLDDVDASILTISQKTAQQSHNQTHNQTNNQIHNQIHNHNSQQMRSGRLKANPSFVEDEELSMEVQQQQNHTQSYHLRQTQNRGHRSDEGALTAILALLPELTPESLSIVLQTICDLSKQQE
ncbi:Protein C21orf2 like protein [Tritrichomonas foetus]|uniref:Protein C21orf2 like protein n=1 Tax=Tritrichomonas foetus TaxID=1144522 RepID=A0A1J4KQH7_9EUKA|nr:Protein C21orf2 like protein [Tritrichomonas foetus]|eukprot:OHT11942.1 Protein C21orf2 like protein [Tritrichomonas foetus]